MKNSSTRYEPRSEPPVEMKDAPAGMVNYCVNGPSTKNKAQDYGPAKMVDTLRKGLPFQELEALRFMLSIPMDRLASLLMISKATLHRRKASGRLDQLESDRVVRFARLVGKAVEVIESEEGARQWLAAPQRGLGGAIPLEFAGTEVGAREVEDLLTRIDHGVYS